MDAPGLNVLLRKAKHAVWNAHLGNPPVRRHAYFGVPDGIPGFVVALIRAAAASARTAASFPLRLAQTVELHPGGVDRERVGRPSIEIRIDGQDEPVGSIQFVAAPQRPVDSRRLVVEHRGADEEAVRSVQDADLGRMRGRRSFPGLELSKFGSGFGGLPCRLIQPAVDADAPLERHRAHGSSGVLAGRALPRVLCAQTVRGGRSKQDRECGGGRSCLHRLGGLGTQ